MIIYILYVFTKQIIYNIQKHLKLKRIVPNIKKKNTISLPLMVWFKRQRRKFIQTAAFCRQFQARVAAFGCWQMQSSQGAVWLQNKEQFSFSQCRQLKDQPQLFGIVSSGSRQTSKNPFRNFRKKNVILKSPPCAGPLLRSEGSRDPHGTGAAGFAKPRRHWFRSQPRLRRGKVGVHLGLWKLYLTRGLGCW